MNQQEMFEVAQEDRIKAKDKALQEAIDYLRVCSSLMATKDYSDDFYTDLNNVIDSSKEALEL